MNSNSVQEAAAMGRVTVDVKLANNREVNYGDRRTAKRDVAEQVEVELLGRKSTFDAILEPAPTTVLVGAIVLEALDLLVDCRNQQLIPRDPAGMTAEIE